LQETFLTAIFSMRDVLLGG